MARVCMGGTFDVIHRGHRALLATAFREGDEGVFVGVTTDEMATERRHRDVAILDERLEALQEFLKEQGWWDRAEVAPIEDPIGRALEPGFDTIVVSEETIRGAEVVNERRQGLGREALRVVVAPLVLADDGRRISATRIREGELDLEGHLQRALRVAVGSENPVKVEAVRRALQQGWPGEVRVAGHGVPSGVDEQPRGDDTAQGALQRARRALEADPEADWGVGIEAGLVHDPLLDDLLDVQVCVIVDAGHRVSLGRGPAFQYPPDVVEAVEAGRTVGEAMDLRTGTADVGRRMGAIGVLSKGALDRTALTEPAVLMALVPRLNPADYRMRRVDDVP